MILTETSIKKRNRFPIFGKKKNREEIDKEFPWNKEKSPIF